MRRTLASLALATCLAATGCTHPNGEVDWGSTALLGLGAVALGTIAVAASKDDHGRDRCYGRRGCGGYGYGHGYRNGHGGYGQGYGYRQQPGYAYARPSHGGYRRW